MTMTAPTPAIAPISMKPSAPSERTPDFSVRISPSAASAKGTAKPGMLLTQLTRKSISRLPCTQWTR